MAQLGRARVILALLAALACVALLASFWSTNDAERIEQQQPLDTHETPVQAPAIAQCPPLTAKPRAPRMLYSIALYNLKQVMYTYHMLDAIRDICEAGYDVHVVLDVHDPIEPDEKRKMEKTMYCARTGSTVPLEVVECPDCRLNLTMQHKPYMLRELDNYDIFAYSEDDMILSVGNLKAYLAELEHLRKHFPVDSLKFWPGFLRYENPVQCNNDKTIASYERHDRIIWEHKAQEFAVLRLPGAGDYLLTYSPHQAMWVLTRDELAHLEHTCKFLTSTKNYNNGGVRIWVSSYQHVVSCGRLRLIPVDRLYAFMIHHAPDKNFKRRSSDMAFTFTELEGIIQDLIKNGTYATSIDQAMRFLRRGVI